jgi:hypothetical protein
MSKFKVGDEIRFIDGDIFKIKKVNDGSYLLTEGGILDFMFEDKYKLVEEPKKEYSFDNWYDPNDDMFKEPVECASSDYEKEFEIVREELGHTQTKLSIALETIQLLSMLLEE